jgi:hypothetical protein
MALVIGKRAWSNMERRFGEVNQEEAEERKYAV